MIVLKMVRVKPNSDRDAEAVDDARHHVARLVVGAEPVLRVGGEGAGTGRS